ncbi:hypothetical protein P3T76_011694 [Phytophthora citrophthora]|uniref:Reverse transcriptase n=1 Tax=Phytophthora citrophthora TaxID=4793 RepID=A0AAD9G8N3_9STRA|nr:hypothetical protein P3T76_011694 [Phytophthora citrophthora]
MKIRGIQRDKNCLPAILGPGIPPRQDLDQISENLIPKRRIRPPASISAEMFEADLERYVLRFDGGAKTSTRLGSCEHILWQLPWWNVFEAEGSTSKDVSANDSDNCGLLDGLKIVLERGVQDLAVVEGSRIATPSEVRCSASHGKGV